MPLSHLERSLKTAEATKKRSQSMIMHLKGYCSTVSKNGTSYCSANLSPSSVEMTYRGNSILCHRHIHAFNQTFLSGISHLVPTSIRATLLVEYFSIFSIQNFTSSCIVQLDRNKLSICVMSYFQNWSDQSHRSK